MEKNEVKKELYKSKVNAKFSHYAIGNLYYTVQLEDGLYQFPIPTVELHTGPLFKLEAGTQTSPERVMNYVKYNKELYDLSADLGQTYFYAEIKGSELNRWIEKAFDKGEFIKVG
jgi:hypothetical protein